MQEKQSNEYVIVRLLTVNAFYLFRISFRDPAQKVGLGYNLRSALPGEPDVDYPILGRIPDTSFKCHGRRDGK